MHCSDGIGRIQRNIIQSLTTKMFNIFFSRMFLSNAVSDHNISSQTVWVVQYIRFDISWKQSNSLVLGIMVRTLPRRGCTIQLDSGALVDVYRVSAFTALWTQLPGPGEIWRLSIRREIYSEGFWSNLNLFVASGTFYHYAYETG